MGSTIKKGLVCSGGGCKGAFTAGILYANQKEYTHYYGTSTGSLNILLASVNKYDELKYFYTNTGNKNIYDINPFNKKRKLNTLKSIYRYITGKNTIASTKKLLTTIRKVYTYADHEYLKNSNKEVVVTVTNLTKKEPEYKSNKDYNWEDFTYWVWVSTLAYPYSETVFINGFEYGDGGFSVNLPVLECSKYVDSMDIIVLVPKKDINDFKNNNVIKGITSIVELLLGTSMHKDITTGKHIKNKEKKWFFTPYLLTDLPMFFDKKEMTKWFKLGEIQK